MVAGGLAGCGESVRAARLPALHAGRRGPESVFTLGGLPPNPTATMNLMTHLGVGVVHIYVNWASIAPRAASFHRPNFAAGNPDAYPASGWKPYDTLVRGLTARHIAVNLALTGPPPFWAEGPGDPERLTEPQWKPNVGAYAAWVKAVGIRYSGHFTPAGGSRPLPRVGFWSLWNEPNLGSSLAPETTHSGSSVEVAPATYRRLLDAGWASLRATGHGRDRILIGELGPEGGTLAGEPGLFSAMTPLRFLRALYCVNAAGHQLRGAAASQRGCPSTAAASARFATRNPALFDASGFAVHPYSFYSIPPTEPVPDEPQDFNLANLPSFAGALDRLMGTYGSDRKLAIWSTEFGYITNPPNPGYTITPQRAALYLNWAEYLTWEDPRLKSFDQYLVTDPPNGQFATGIETAAGVPKPALAAFTMPLYLPVTTTTQGHPLLVWGAVRPAPSAQRKTRQRQVVQIQIRSGPEPIFHTVKRVTIINPHGYFETQATFPGTGSVRLRWTYPDGQTIESRTSEITLRQPR